MLSSPLLLGLVWFAPAGASAQAAVSPPSDPVSDRAQFDRLIQSVESGDLVVTSPQEIRSVVQRLDTLRPQDDVLRELRLRGFRCDYDDLGPPASGLAFARAGLVDAQRLGDVGSQIRFGLCEAYYIDAAGQIAQSVAPIEAALTLARQHGEPRLLAQALGRRGNLRSLLGQQAAALSDFLEALRVLEDGGLKKEAEAGLHEIAIAYRRMGDLEMALDYLRQSIAFARREGQWGLLAVSLLQTGFVHEDSGRYAQAVEAERRAAQVASEHGLDYEFAAAHMAMAAAETKRGRFDAAAASLSIARNGFDRFGDRSNEGMLRLLEGQVRAGRGDHAGALKFYAESARAFQLNPNPRYQVELYAVRARSHEALGNFRAALEDLKLERSGRRALNEESRTQQSLLAQYQFHTARRDLENARLQAGQRSQAQRLAAIERANRWQLAALVSGGLLLALLLFLLLRQLHAMGRIKALALTDALTGVANRRRIEIAAAEAVDAARAQARPLALLTFDLDYFKRINDSHGHARGDQVLVRVARACELALRPRGLLGRIGGEEFIALLPNTSLDAALQLAERLRENVERIDWSDLAPELTVTISVGVSMLRDEDHALHDVIDRADAALYRAKAAGRNRVEAEEITVNAPQGRPPAAKMDRTHDALPVAAAPGATRT